MNARDPTLGQRKSHQRVAMVALFYVDFYVGLNQENFLSL